MNCSKNCWGTLFISHRGLMKARSTPCLIIRQPLNGISPIPSEIPAVSPSLSTQGEKRKMSATLKAQKMKGTVYCNSSLRWKGKHSCFHGTGCYHGDALKVQHGEDGTVNQVTVYCVPGLAVDLTNKRLRIGFVILSSKWREKKMIEKKHLY